jgi:hypothetical protein
LWRSIHMLFGIVVPVNMTDLYQHWSKLETKKYDLLLLTAAATLLWAIWITRNEVVFDKCLWAIWITRNEVVFDKCRPKSLLQVLLRGTHWLCQWASLQRHDDLKDQLISAAQHLETSTVQFHRIVFAKTCCLCLVINLFYSKFVLSCWGHSPFVWSL